MFDEEAEPQPGGQGSQGNQGGRLQSGGKRKRSVAKPGTIKAMVMGMGGVTRKKKEVCVCDCDCVCVTVTVCYMCAGEQSLYCGR